MKTKLIGAKETITLAYEVTFNHRQIKFQLRIAKFGMESFCIHVIFGHGEQPEPWPDDIQTMTMEMIVFGHHQTSLSDGGCSRTRGKWSRDNGTILLLTQTADHKKASFGLIDEFDRLSFQPVRVAKGPYIEVAFNDEELNPA